MIHGTFTNLRTCHGIFTDNLHMKKCGIFLIFAQNIEGGSNGYSQIIIMF